MGALWLYGGGKNGKKTTEELSIPPNKEKHANCETNQNLVINHGILGYPIHYNCASDHGIQVTTPKKNAKNRDHPTMCGWCFGFINHQETSRNTKKQGRIWTIINQDLRR